MKKILIVDDEVLVRMGFRSVLDWEACGYAVVGDAADGREAMEKIRQLRPDLVFTDLMMDGMDGFELMRCCGAEFPDIKFIVLSSYNDFDNVREAMRCGALDYVFKLDIKADSLHKMLLNINWGSADPQASHPAEERAMRAALISHAITRDMPEAQARESFAKLYPQLHWEKPFALITIAIDNYDLVHTTAQARMSQNDIRAIENVLAQALGPKVTMCPFHADRTLLLWQDGVTALPELQASYAKAEEYVGRYLNRSMTAVMSESFPSLWDLPQAYAQNEESLSYRYMLDYGRIHGYRLPDTTEKDNLLSRADSSALEVALQLGDAQSVLQSCAALFSSLGRRRGYPLPQLRVFLLDMLFAIKRVYPEIATWQNEQGYTLEKLIQRADRLGVVREAMEQALMSVMAPAQPLSPVGQGQPREEIRQIIAYVREHLDEEMTVAKAAKMTQLSESYFAHVFKREVHSSFADWVNRERIVRATDLLASSDLRVHEIAEQVGIDNANYFSALFKKVTGKTPLELRHAREKQNRDRKNGKKQN